MVAFSAWYDPDNMGEVAKTFTYALQSNAISAIFITFIYRLIFPRWDVIALILSMFLMTYTYIEAKSNYHRGSILILRFVLRGESYMYFLIPFQLSGSHCWLLFCSANGGRY